jgi:hypothetical protein
MRFVVPLLAVLPLAFAPVPPYRPKPAEQVLLSRLKSHGKVTGLWDGVELSVAGVDGKRLTRPVLTSKRADGKVAWVATAAEGEVQVAPGGALSIRLRQVVYSASDGSMSFCEERTMDLPRLPGR